MKVSELRAILASHNPNASVEIQWEMTFHEIGEDNIYLAAEGTVILDADGNFYKKRIMEGHAE